MAFTKEKLITRLQTQIDLDKQESHQIMELLLEIMKDALANREGLLITGFGKFSVRQKNARRGRNPQTKERLGSPFSTARETTIKPERIRARLNLNFPIVNPTITVNKLPADCCHTAASRCGRCGYPRCWSIESAH